MVCPDIGFVSNGDVANLKGRCADDLLYSLPPIYRNRGS